VPLDDIEVHFVGGLHGEPGALATLLTDHLDPTYRTSIHEPAVAGLTRADIRRGIVSRSEDPTFPFEYASIDIPHFRAPSAPTC
jgi:hypothetical protein